MVTTFERILGSLAIPSVTVHSLLLPAHVRSEISQSITQCEIGSVIEVQVVVEGSLSLLEIVRGRTSRSRAEEIFCLKKTWDTKRRTGILLYVNIADHAIEVVADRGIPAGDFDFPGIIRGATEQAKNDTNASHRKTLLKIIHSILGEFARNACASPTLALKEGELDENELAD